MEATTLVGLFVAYTALFLLLAACWLFGWFDGLKFNLINSVSKLSPVSLVNTKLMTDDLNPCLQGSLMHQK